MGPNRKKKKKSEKEPLLSADDPYQLAQEGGVTRIQVKSLIRECLRWASKGGDGGHTAPHMSSAIRSRKKDPLESTGADQGEPSLTGSLLGNWEHSPVNTRHFLPKRNGQEQPGSYLGWWSLFLLDASSSGKGEIEQPQW